MGHELNFGLHFDLDLVNLSAASRQVAGDSGSELSDLCRDGTVVGTNEKFAQTEIGNPSMGPQSLRDGCLKTALKLQETLTVARKVRQMVTGGQIFLKTVRHD